MNSNASIVCFEWVQVIDVTGFSDISISMLISILECENLEALPRVCGLGFVGFRGFKQPKRGRDSQNYLIINHQDCRADMQDVA